MEAYGYTTPGSEPLLRSSSWQPVPPPLVRCSHDSVSWRTRGRRRLRRRRRRRKGTTTLLPTVVEKRGLPPSHVTKGRESPPPWLYPPIYPTWYSWESTGGVGIRGKRHWLGVLFGGRCKRELRGNPFRLLRLDYCTQRRRKGLFLAIRVQYKRGGGERKKEGFIGAFSFLPFPLFLPPTQWRQCRQKRLGKNIDAGSLRHFDLWSPTGPTQTCKLGKKRKGLELRFTLFSFSVCLWSGIEHDTVTAVAPLGGVARPRLPPIPPSPDEGGRRRNKSDFSLPLPVFPRNTGGAFLLIRNSPI